MFMTLFAIVFLSGGHGEGSVLQVYNRSPLPGVVSSVYGATDIVKPELKKVTAFNSYIEIDFTKNFRGKNDNNYLTYLDTAGTDTLDISTDVFAIFARDTINESDLVPSADDDFAQYDNNSPGATNWIVKPLSYVFTILPMTDASAAADYDIDDEDGTIDDIEDYDLYQPALITLKYDKFMSDPYGTVSVLYRKADPGAADDEWEILPAIVDAAKGTATATFAKDGFGTYCVVNLDGNFNEFPQTGATSVSWAQQYVTKLWSNGIMSQTRGSVGDFGLLNGGAEYNMTRGEFASMLVKGMRLPLETNVSEEVFHISYDNFDDVGDPDDGNDVDDLVRDGIDYFEYYPDWIEYVYTSAKYGLFNGFREGDELVFKPNDYITREQAAALIARSAKLKVEVLSEEDVTFAQDAKGKYTGKICKALQTKKITDIEDISPWALPYVLAVYNAKYMEGFTDGTFRPTSSITRAQSAKLTYKLLNNLKLIQ